MAVARAGRRVISDLWPPVQVDGGQDLVQGVGARVDRVSQRAGLRRRDEDVGQRVQRPARVADQRVPVHLEVDRNLVAVPEKRDEPSWVRGC